MEEACIEHTGQSYKECSCIQPFWLHKFPSVLKNLEGMKEWIRLIRRTTRNGAWAPGESVMLCSEHFVDGMPTGEHPYS